MVASKYLFSKIFTDACTASELEASYENLLSQLKAEKRNLPRKRRENESTKKENEAYENDRRRKEGEGERGECVIKGGSAEKRKICLKKLCIECDMAEESGGMKEV